MGTIWFLAGTIIRNVLLPYGFDLGSLSGFTSLCKNRAITSASNGEALARSWTK